MKKIKAFISLLLVILLMFSTFIVASAFDPKPYYLGDADLDDTVNIKDATLIQKHVASIETLADYALITADADEDSQITVKDATVIQKFVASLPVDNPVGEIITFNAEPVFPTEAPTIAPTIEPTEEPTQEPTEEPTTVPTEPEEKMDTNITIYFSNNKNWKVVKAYLYNEQKGIENATWPGVAMTLLGTNDFGEQIYKMDVDVSEYNRVVFNNGTSQTMNAALSVASSGFYIAKDTPKKSMALGIYAYDEANYGTQKTIKLDYPDGYQKPITIWTPNGYNPADTTKKYPVIYLLDGQNQFLGTTNGYGGWVTDKIATCLQNNGHDGFILVGIDNSRNRDNELTPDIGNVVPQYANQGFENGSGERFSNFVADVVVPYVQANYNVSDKPEDNAIIGSSSGGIEAFYIGMENMDVFGKIGAISPAFMLFPKSDWDKYLAKFDFSDERTLPRIYFYNGGGDSLEVELNPYAEAMPKWMTALGYPEDKVTFCHEDTFAHNEYAWRMIMPETIAWLFEL